MTTPEIAEKLSIAGTPEECAAQIKEIESAGVNHMILCITDPYILKLFAQRDVDVPDVQGQLELIANEVMPAFSTAGVAELGGAMAVTSEQEPSTQEQRVAFWALADVLIPETGSMPAASEAGSVEKWLERALAARPDLVAPLAAVLDAAAGRDPRPRPADCTRKIRTAAPRSRRSPPAATT